MAEPFMTQAAFIAKHHLPSNALEEAGIEWAVLEAIYKNHQSDTERLQRIVNSLAGDLQQLTKVHSVRVRIKNPEHLIATILRKPYKGITIGMLLI